MFKMVGITAATLLSASTLIGCSATQTSSQTQATTEPHQVHVIGGDRDAHGCIPSAGYQWSQVLNHCIRVFESGIRLDPIKKTSTSAAYIIFNQPRDKAELFLSGHEKSMILNKLPHQNIWRQGDISITFDDGYNVLHLGEVIYKQHIPSK